MMNCNIIRPILDFKHYYRTERFNEVTDKDKDKASFEHCKRRFDAGLNHILNNTLNHTQYVKWYLSINESY